MRVMKAAICDDQLAVMGEGGMKEILVGRLASIWLRCCRVLFRETLMDLISMMSLYRLWNKVSYERNVLWITGTVDRIACCESHLASW